MGAESMDLPALFMPAGPMLRGNFAGKVLGSGSDTWKYWADLRAGLITQQEWKGVEGGIARSAGHCMTMGTASTMTSAVEALGVTLPGAASIPAADSRHAVMAAQTGRRIVEMVWEDVRLSDILDPHGVSQLDHDGVGDRRFHQRDRAPDRHGPPDRGQARSGGLRGTQPPHAVPGQHPALRRVLDGGLLLRGRAARAVGDLGDLLDTDAVTANGKTLGENIAGAKVFDDDVIRTRDNPIIASDTLAVLYGNLAPDGAVIKPPAAEPKLLQHSGPAVVFENYDDMAARIDDPDLVVDEDSVLVLQNAGPQGAPGHAGMGAAADPEEAAGEGRARHGAHLRRPDERHQLRRVRAARGARVVHRRAARPGRDGDIIELDVPGRSST